MSLVKKFFICLFCNLIPLRNKRRQIREYLLSSKIPKGGIELCLYKLDYLENLMKFTFDIRNLPPATGDHALIQKVSLSILHKFAEIMVRNKVKWWLDSGTLIGYVRHGGFIPWDDDIDIAMMREDYERLPELLSGDFIEEGFFYRVGEITRLYFGSLRVWVDVFPMDRGGQIKPLTGDEYYMFIKRLNRIKSKMIFDGKLWLKRESPVSKEYLEYCKQQRDSTLVKNPVENGFIFYGVETCAKDRTLFPNSYIFPLKEVNFLGIAAYIPQQYDSYLFAIYGDYMSWPMNFRQKHDSTFASNMSVSQRNECVKIISKYYPIREIYNDGDR